MQTVDNFEIKDQFDTLKNLSNGVYANRMITHDSFNKTFSEIDFDYNTYFPTIFHTEHDAQNGGLTDNKSQLPLFNYQDDKMISDKPEARINFVSDTTKLQNDYVETDTKEYYLVCCRRNYHLDHSVVIRLQRVLQVLV